MEKHPSCPRCGYDQSGAIAAWERNEPPSCPLRGVCTECGLDFDWVDVMRPGRDPPRWSFEHAERPLIRSFVSTASRALLAPWIWLRLRMAYPVVGRRLWLFALSCTCLSHLIIAGLSGWIAESVAAASAYWQSGIDVPVPRPLAYLLLPYRRTPIGFGTDPLFDRSLIVTCVATALAPILLLLLRQTLVRYSVRRHHMARGAAYSTAWLPILAIAYLGARVWSIGGWRALVFFAPGQTSWDSWAPVLDAIDTRMLWVGERPWIAAAASVTWQSAYWLSFTRLYLRLPHSVGLTVSLLAVSWLGAVLMVGLWPGSPLFSELGNAIFGLRP